MTRKCKVRNWSFAKFKLACIKRAKRLSLKLNVAGLRKAYDDNLSIPFTVATLGKAAK